MAYRDAFGPPDGERTLGLKFFANLSSLVRILVGVPFVLVLFAVGALLGS